MKELQFRELIAVLFASEAEINIFWTIFQMEQAPKKICQKMLILAFKVIM